MKIIIKNVRMLCEHYKCTLTQISEYLGKEINEDIRLTSNDLDRLADVFSVTARQLTGDENLNDETLPALVMTDFSQEDFNAVSAVRRVAENSIFMSKLLEN